MDLYGDIPQWKAFRYTASVQRPVGNAEMQEVSNNSGSSMGVVGLVSGGKDSLYALHACAYLGYRIVAVAHIRSANVTEEIDSYMYQTVGSQCIESIAECLGVPLVTHVLSGKPVRTESTSYEPTEGDEVEDLRSLLCEVMRRFPNVAYVCTGAILSDYQRERVENVCQRLGLRSLAFLWKFQQSVLLRLMASTTRFDARLIKVASMGLGEKDLGLSLRQLAPKFLRLEKEFGFHACGEGGEFETIVLDSPLFRKRRLKEPTWNYVVHSDSPFAPVVFLCACSCVETVVVETTYDQEDGCKSFETHFSIVPNFQLYLEDAFAASSFVKFLTRQGSFFNRGDSVLLSYAEADDTAFSISLDGSSFSLSPHNGVYHPEDTRVVADFPWVIFSKNAGAQPENGEKFSNSSLFSLKEKPPQGLFYLHGDLETTPQPTAKVFYAPQSCTLWRPVRPLHLMQDPLAVSLADVALITDWFWGDAPHNGEVISGDEQFFAGLPSDIPRSLVVILGQLAMAIRNLRNSFLDWGYSLSHVRVLDIGALNWTDEAKELTNAQEGVVSPALLTSYLQHLWAVNGGFDDSPEATTRRLRDRRSAIWLRDLETLDASFSTSTLSGMRVPWRLRYMPLPSAGPKCATVAVKAMVLRASG